MKSGAPMAGTAELGLMNLMIGQLARKYRLPWRSSGMLTGSKVTDAQAGYEVAFNMFPILLAGANFVMHCAGWTEAGPGRELRQVRARLPSRWRCSTSSARARASTTSTRRLPPSRDRPRRPLPRHGAHPGPLPGRLLHVRAVRQQQLRAVAELDGAKDAETRGLEAARNLLDNYAPPPSTRRSTKPSWPSSANAKRSCRIA